MTPRPPQSTGRGGRPVAARFERFAPAALLLVAALAGCFDERGERPAGSRCRSDDECAEGLICQYGRCRPVCVFDRDCPSGACIPSEEDPDLRVCAFPDEGRDGVDCPGGTRPDADGVCREPCANDEDCADGYECVDDFCVTEPSAGWRTAGPHALSVTSVVVDPLAPTTLYAAGAGVYRSGDGGETWRAARSGLEDAGSVATLAIDPVETSRLYAGTADGVYATADRGESWARASSGLGGERVRVVVVDHMDPQVVYAAIDGVGVFRSADRAATWEARNDGLTSTVIYFDALVMDPDDSARLWLGTWQGGVFETREGGRSWALYGTAPTNIYSLARGSGALYAGTFDHGVHRIVDGGSGWEETAAGPDRVRSLAADPAGTLYVGTGSHGVYRTRDRGESWDHLDRGLPVLDTNGHIAIHPDVPSILYVGTAAGVVRSEDSGASWTLLAEGFPPTDVRSLGVRADRPDRVLALSARSGPFASDDRGRSWASKSAGLGGFHAEVDALAVHPLDPEKVVVASFVGIDRSLDGGETWAGPAQGGSFFSAAADPGHAGVFYAAEFSEGLWRSDDWGESWTLTPLDVDRIKAVAVDARGFVYAGDQDTGVHKSTDGGASWEGANDGLPVGAEEEIDAAGHLAVDPSEPDRLFVALPDGVYRSVDGGLHWSPTGLDEAVSSFVVDPANPDRLFAGGGAGVFESRDGGETWSRPDLGLAVHALALSPDGATLYAATYEGVWVR